LQSLFEPGSFFKKQSWLGSHPTLGASARDIAKKKKTSMIESAQTILGGIKENSQSSKLPTQSWGMIKKIQKIQKI